MSRPFFVLVTVRIVVPAGQRIEFYKPVILEKSLSRRGPAKN